MKCLVIATIAAPPKFSGSQKCVIEYCQLLKDMGVDLYYLYISGLRPERPQSLSILKSYWGNHLFIYKRRKILDIIKRSEAYIHCKFTGFNMADDWYPSGLTSYVKKLQKQHQFDSIIINYLTLSKLYESNIGCQKILFSHDTFTFKKKRLGVDSFWCDLKPNEEAKALQRCDTILSIQENESIFFRYLHPHGKIESVYSVFSIHNQPLTYNQNILFLSGKSTLNVNGIKWFIDKIFPLVLIEFPMAKLIIGGSICNVLENIPSENIILTGVFDNEKDFYQLGDVVINPIYQGTGLKIKTFEAMSFGKVTIVHPHSAEGIYDANNAPLLIGNSVREYALNIIKVLKNKQLREMYAGKSIQYIAKMNEFVRSQYQKILFEL